MKRLIRLSMAASALTVILLLVSSMQSQSLKASSNENIKIEKSMRQERKKASDDANMGISAFPSMRYLYTLKAGGSKHR